MKKLNIILLVILATMSICQDSWAQTLMEVEGEFDVNGNRITNVQDPLIAQDVATKAYADSVLLSFFGFLLEMSLQESLNAGVSPLALINAGADTTDFIGLNYQGGIIFYMRTDGTGLVAAATDQSAGAEWGCEGTDITGAAGITIGTGKPNTAAIVIVVPPPSMCSPPPVRAADICHDLMLNGYDDWFLPSAGELVEIRLKIGQGAASPNTNIGGFQNAPYWSSTNLNDNSALFVHFLGTNYIATQKSSSMRVRAIREF